MGALELFRVGDQSVFVNICRKVVSKELECHVTGTSGNGWTPKLCNSLSLDFLNLVNKYPSFLQVGPVGSMFYFVSWKSQQDLGPRCPHCILLSKALRIDFLPHLTSHIPKFLGVLIQIILVSGLASVFMAHFKKIVEV